MNIEKDIRTAPSDAEITINASNSEDANAPSTLVGEHRDSNEPKLQPANPLRTVSWWIVAAVVIVGIGLYAYSRWTARESLPEGLIQANGRIEGDRVSVSSKSFGRISELLVREGDRVAHGQCVARMDDAQVKSRVLQGKHAVTVAHAILQQTQIEAEAIDADIQSLATSLETTRKKIPLVIESAKADLARAKVEVETTLLEFNRRQVEFMEREQLFQAAAVSSEELESARLARDVARNSLAVNKQLVVQADCALAKAQLGHEEVKGRESELKAARLRREKVDAAILEARARRDQSAASLAEAQAMLEDLTVYSPTSGTVTTRMVDQGETVASGGGLLSIVDLNRLYVQVYIPETVIGKIRLGSRARIHVDAFENQSFAATVRYISSQAEFTPKEVQTPDERVKLVYAVRLYLDENPDHALSPGLPADAVIRWKSNVPWQKPIW